MKIRDLVLTNLSRDGKYFRENNLDNQSLQFQVIVMNLYEDNLPILEKINIYHANMNIYHTNMILIHS